MPPASDQDPGTWERLPNGRKLLAKKEGIWNGYTPVPRCQTTCAEPNLNAEDSELVCLCPHVQLWQEGRGARACLVHAGERSPPPPPVLLKPRSAPAPARGAPCSPRRLVRLCTQSHVPPKLRSRCWSTWSTAPEEGQPGDLWGPHRGERRGSVQWHPSPAYEPDPIHFTLMQNQFPVQFRRTVWADCWGDILFFFLTCFPMQFAA